MGERIASCLLCPVCSRASVLGVARSVRLSNEPRILSAPLEAIRGGEVLDAPVLLLDERIKPDGTHARTWAVSEGDRLRLSDADGPSGELSVVAVDRVMCRYGRPLEHGIALEGDSLTFGDYRLRRLRYHAVVDAEGRDYLVWERPDGEPLACVASMVTAALRYLALRLADERPQESET